MTRAEAIETLDGLLSDAGRLSRGQRDAVAVARTSLALDESLRRADWALRDAVRADVRDARQKDIIEKGGI